MKVFTIGFTQTTAEAFFARLQASGATKVVDVRLNNRSQLAGFAKQADLRYFLRAIAGLGYVHEPALAPTQDLLDAYKKDRGPWDVYAERFLALLAARRVEETCARGLLEGACLLCSEPSAARCHRRLVAEYLGARWGGFDIVHL